MDGSFERLPDDCVFETVDSPVGELVVLGNDAGVHWILWKGQHRQAPYAARLRHMNAATPNSPVDLACLQLAEYFSGQRTEFDVPIVLNGTSFQKRAWKQLQKIPYGTTMSYQAQAARIGGKEKARAVGMANGRNPIPIIVPCHRVIGKNGSLTGFGGGLDAKRFLLDLESAQTSRGSVPQ